MPDYLPSTDAGLLNWSANFKTQIDAFTDPSQIGLTTENVTAYNSAQASYDAAYTQAIDPSTRGKATVFAKNEAKKTLVAISRELAMAVTNSTSVTDQQRLDMGLTVRGVEPTPVPVPSEAPVIEFTSVQGNRINLRLHQPDSTSRAKPEGVKGATVFSFVGEQAPTELSDWTFEGSITRTTTTLVMPASVAPATKVWVTAFWFNTKSESGPATTPISTYTEHGGLSQAA